MDLKKSEKMLKWIWGIMQNLNQGTRMIVTLSETLQQFQEAQWDEKFWNSNQELQLREGLILLWYNG